MKTEQIAMYAAIFVVLFIILRWRTTRESELLDKLNIDNYYCNVFTGCVLEKEKTLKEEKGTRR